MPLGLSIVVFILVKEKPLQIKGSDFLVTGINQSFIFT